MIDFNDNGPSTINQAVVERENDSPKTDFLNRTEFLDNLMHIIEIISGCTSPRKGRISFAIDGKWGCGKTFVIDMLEKRLEESHQYLVLHYNAWKYDFYEEPAIAIITSIIDHLAKQDEYRKDRIALGRISKALLPLGGKILTGYIKNKTDVDLEEAVQDVIEAKDKVEESMDELKKESEEIDELFSFREEMEKLQKQLTETSRSKTIVFVVDELDRCQPSYAITVLERLHHVFYGLDNSVMILAVDQSQLDASIKSIFGENTTVDRYMRKFIDFRLSLDNGSQSTEAVQKYRYYFNQFEEGDKRRDAEAWINTLFDIANFEMRTQEQIMQAIHTAHKLTNTTTKDPGLMVFEAVYAISRVMRDESIRNGVVLNAEGSVNRDIILLKSQSGKVVAVQSTSNDACKEYENRFLAYCEEVIRVIRDCNYQTRTTDYGSKRVVGKGEAQKAVNYLPMLIEAALEGKAERERVYTVTTGDLTAVQRAMIEDAIRFTSICRMLI